MKQLTPILRSKEQARRYYNRISGIYDWLTASEKSLIKNGVDTLSPQAGEKILEIGCGTGTGLKFILNKLNASGTVVGLDLSHKMLLESKAKTSANLLQGDASELPITRAVFDGVFCSFTLELFSEKEILIVLKEIHRVLHTDGRLVVIALAKHPYTLAVRLYEVAHKLFPVAVDCRPIPLRQIIEENGFKILSTDKMMNWGLPVERVECKPD